MGNGSSAKMITIKNKKIDNTDTLKLKNFKSRRQDYIEVEEVIKNQRNLKDGNELKEENLINTSKYNCQCDQENCKYEDWRLLKSPYIVGFNSNKIGNDIIASQRPSDCLMKDYMIIKQFKL